MSELKLEERIARVENKIDILLQEQKATQRAIAHIKADIPEVVKSALNKRAIQGYTRIIAG